MGCAASTAIDAHTTSHDLLFLACREGDLTAVQRLLKRYKRRHKEAGVCELVNQVDANGESLLVAACRRGHSRLVPILLLAGANARRATATGETPLHIAAANNDTDTLTALLARDESVGTAGGDLYFPPTTDDTSVGIVLPRRFTDVEATTANDETPLFVAAKHGHKDVVRELLACHARTEAKNEDGWTPLHITAKHGHTDVVRVLLAHNASVDAALKTGETPLLIAASNNRADVVNALLAHGANAEISATSGATPLHIAANNNHISVASALLAHGANANAATKTGMTPLFLAAQSNYKDVVLELLAHGADVDAFDDDYDTALYVASEGGHEDIVLALLQHGANAEIPAATTATPLHIAANMNRVGVVSALLAHGVSANANMTDDFTPLHVAANKNHVDVAMALLARGANVNAVTTDLATPLSVAAFSGHVAVAAVLLAHNADVDLASTRGETPLCIAAEHGRSDVVTLLLKHSANTDKATTAGTTPLFIATLNGHNDIVIELLAHNADVNAALAGRTTPLHAAAQRGHVDSVVALLARGAHVNAAGVGGLTPLYIAVQNGHAGVVSALLEYNADVNAACEDGATALHRAAESGYTDITRSLLAAHVSVNAVKAPGTTPLHTAATKGHTDVAVALLTHGAAVDAATSSGITALFFATHFGHTALVTALLEHNADVDAANATGETALHVAAAAGRTDIVARLLAWRANADHACATGETPLHIAAKHGHNDIVLDLLAHGAAIEARTMTGETPLHVAALNGRVDVVTELLARDADTEAANNDGQTALHGATKIGHANVVRALLAAQASVDATAQQDWTTLHIAAKTGRKDIAVALLAHNASVDAVAIDDATPLYIAAKHGHDDVVDELLAHGANAEATVTSCATPLHAAAQNGHTGVVRTLLAHRASVDATTVTGVTPLHAAASNDHMDVVVELLAHYACVNVVEQRGVTPLLLAAQNGYVDVVTQLLAHNASVDVAMTTTGQTPLYLAAQNGHRNVVAILLAHNATVDAATTTRETPLHVAAEHGHIDVVRELLVHGANADATTAKGWTPMLAAAQNGHSDTVFELLASGADVDVVSADGVSVFHVAAHFGHTDLTAALLARSTAHVASSASTGWTPLHLAAASGNLDDVRLLVDSSKRALSPDSTISSHEPQTEPSTLSDSDKSLSPSAMLEVADNDGDTPVLAAARAGHFHVVRFLLDAGASAVARARNGETLLMIAAQGRHERIVAELVQHDSESSHASLVTVTLETLRASAHDVYEFHDMWMHAVDHLDAVYTRLATGPQAAVLPLALLVCHVVRLKTMCAAASVFARIAASPTAASRFRDVHAELAFLEQDDSASSGADGATTLLTDWAVQCAQDETALLERFNDSIDAVAALAMHDEAAFSKVHGDASLLLRHKVRTQSHTYSPALLEYLSKYLGITTHAIAGSSATLLPEWFISPHELELARATRSTEPHQSAPATALVRGEWASAAIVATQHTQMQRETFVACIETCVDLSHPNVVKVYGATHLQLPLVAVYEDARSTNLRSYLADEATKPLIWLKLAEVARGLQYLTERGVILEILRCDDIWIGTDGLAKVNAFSCLALDDMDAQVRASAATRANARRQRMQWVAPECLRGAAATAASTVFSLGVCMLEAFTGELPWKRAEPDFVAHVTKYGSRPPVPDAMPAIARDLLTQLWREDPQQRPSLASVALELKRIADAMQQQQQDGNDRSRSLRAPASHVRFDLCTDIVPVLGASVQTFVARLGHKCARCALEQREAAAYVFARCEHIAAVLETQYLVWDTAALTTFVDVLQRFDRFLRFAVSDASVLQLAKSQRVATQRNVFHHQLDDVVRLLGVAAVDPIHDWQARRRDDASKSESESDEQPVPATPETNAVTIVRFANTQVTERFRELDADAIDAVAAGDRSAAARLPWFIHPHELTLAGDAIGTGAFGEVYRATWRQTPVVVKFMGYEADESAYSRELFFHELRVWFPLRHPHVARLFGACHVGKRFFACEFVGGGTLDAHVKTHPHRRWTLLHHVGLGVQHLHSQNVLHNDLKCDNVLIGADDGSAKVIDFGLSSLLQSAEVQVAIKRQGAAHWRSPEYLRGERLTLASDIYALAMLMIECVTGEPPWGRTALDAVVKFRVVKRGAFPRQPARVTAAQWALIRMMGAPDPAQRVQIAFVVDKLREFAQVEQEQQQ